MVGLVGANWISNRAEERGRTSAAIESANESIRNLRGTVETQRETVSELATTVGEVSATVRLLHDSVETQRETVSELATTVTELRVTAGDMHDTVGSIDDAVDALGETVPLLVSCMIDLNQIQGLFLAFRDGAAGDPETAAIQLPDLPESCEQARNRARR